MVMCFSKFGPHFKMVKSERAKKVNKFVENCLNLTFTCLHFALDSGQCLTQFCAFLQGEMALKRAFGL